MCLEQLQQDAAVAVHDRLRACSRPRREEHEQRVVERDGLEGERQARIAEQLVPAEGVRHDVLAVGHVHDVPQRGECGSDGGHLGAAVDSAVAVAVAADGQEHRRLELRQPVDHATGPELGRTARPDRTEARRGGERHERLRDVRQVGRDPVARPDAEAREPGTRPRDLRAELRKGQVDRPARLRARDDGDVLGVLLIAQQVLGEVQARTREPARTRHRLGGEDRAVRRVGLHLEEVPDRRPEGGQVGDRPPLQLVVAGEDEAPLVFEPGEVAADLRRLTDVRRRRPEDAGARQRHDPHPNAPDSTNQNGVLTSGQLLCKSRRQLPSADIRVVEKRSCSRL